MTTTRRGILGALAGVPALALPAAAIAGAPAALAALSAQTVVSPAPSAASATKEEAEGLIEIGRRMPDLLKEFWTAVPLSKAARRGSTRPPRCLQSRGSAQTTRRSACLSNPCSRSFGVLPRLSSPCRGK